MTHPFRRNPVTGRYPKGRSFNMMSRETIANNAAFRLFLIVVVALTIFLALSMNWNREAASTVISPNQNETVVSPPGAVKP